MFVAKRDIGPGRDPMKTMLEDQLLQASALVALCSYASRGSGWLWWEASSVWTRRELVVPLFVDIDAKEFNGPMTLVLQGRRLFEPDQLLESLTTLLKHFSINDNKVELSRDEMAQLEQFQSLYAARERKRDPSREARFKDLLSLVLELKDAAFAADDRADRWSSEMANAEFKMGTLLRQLTGESFPHIVEEYSNASAAAQVMRGWQEVYAAVEATMTAT